MITANNVHDLFCYMEGRLFWAIRPANRVQIGDEVGNDHHSGYRQFEYKGKTYQTHRVIFLMYHGYMPDYVDHRDRNRGNNLIDNLRDITNSENRINSEETWASSTVRGVSIRGDKYESRITKDGTTHQLGTFCTVDEAAKAYKQARQEMFPDIYEEN